MKDEKWRWGGGTSALETCYSWFLRTFESFTDHGNGLTDSSSNLSPSSDLSKDDCVTAKLVTVLERWSFDHIVRVLPRTDLVYSVRSEATSISSSNAIVDTAAESLVDSLLKGVWNLGFTCKT